MLLRNTIVHILELMNSLLYAEEYSCSLFGAEELIFHRSTVVCRGLVPIQYSMGTAYLFLREKFIYVEEYSTLYREHMSAYY